MSEVAKSFRAPISCSRFFRTPAFPAGAGPDFVNAVFLIDGDIGAPQDILAKLHTIEAAYGRHRKDRWAQRTIDLDLLAVADTLLPDRATWTRWRDLPLDRQMKEAPDQLILPHPRIQDRSFVLVPMADVAPDWVHPVTGQSVAQMCAALDPADLASVTPLDMGRIGLSTPEHKPT